MLISETEPDDDDIEELNMPDQLFEGDLKESQTRSELKDEIRSELHKYQGKKQSAKSCRVL